MHTHYYSLLITLSCCLACNPTSPSQETPSTQTQAFDQELEELLDFFQIPGLAVLVKKESKIIYEDYKGFANRKDSVRMDAQKQFPVASLTKIFSGILLMKLVEEGKLSLDDSMSDYLDIPNLNPKIQVKHVLSHTSQGKIGEKFYYSVRFSWLTTVIEKAGKASFEEQMREKIFKPLHLDQTTLLKDSAQVGQEQLDIAHPYLLEDGLQEGFLDFGFSASAGVVSTVRDMAKLDEALDQHTLISAASTKQMFQPFQEDLPYGYGIFSQKFKGKNLVWAYGQYDCHSALFLKVPEEKLTLLLLANNNLMSDPPRLIYGDVRASLFALSFLKNFVFGQSSLKLFEDEVSLKASAVDDVLYREKIRAQALAASFMARFDNSHLNTSKALLKHLFRQFPDYTDYGDLSLMHTISFLKTVHHYKELGPFTQFDEQFLKLGKVLYRKDPQNPYINVYLGGYYAMQGMPDKARPYYHSLVSTPNFSPNWYTREAEMWLNDN